MYIKYVDILGGTVPPLGISRCSRPRYRGKPRWLAKSDSDLKIEPGLPQCGGREPPEPRGGYPQGEGLAGLVRARARHGPSSRQKKSFPGL